MDSAANDFGDVVSNKTLQYALSSWLMHYAMRDADSITSFDERLENRIWDLFWFLEEEEEECDPEMISHLMKCYKQGSAIK